MASSPTASTNPHLLRHHRSNFHGRARSPVIVDNLIDLTSYEEEYDYLVARRRAVSSIAGNNTPRAVHPSSKDDAVSRIRDETATYQGKLEEDENDDLKQVAQMLGLDNNESTVTSQALGDDIVTVQSELVIQRSCDSSAISPRNSQANSPAHSAPTKAFPSSLSFQIREELEELAKVTGLVTEFDEDDKRSIIRLEDILGTKHRAATREKAATSPEPIPATPSLESELYSIRASNGRRNDPDILRMLTPEPIPTTPSLESEFQRSAKTRNSQGSYIVEPATHRDQLRTPDPIPTTPSLEGDFYPSSMKSVQVQKRSGNEGETNDGEGVEIIDVCEASRRSKSVKFLAGDEERELLNVSRRHVARESEDTYGDVDEQLLKESSDVLQSPSFESDPMLGSKSMYRRAILARRRKSAARTGATSFKPIHKEYDDVEFIEESPRHVVRKEKYRSLVISPVRSSMDQEDTPRSWGASTRPGVSTSPFGFDSVPGDKDESARDDDTREDEEERSSLEEEKRDKIDSPRSIGSSPRVLSLSKTGSLSPALHSKSLSPSVEKRVLFQEPENGYDAPILRKTSSHSLRLSKSNPELELSKYALETLTKRTRSPVIIDVETVADNSDTDLTQNAVKMSFVAIKDSPKSSKVTSPSHESSELSVEVSGTTPVERTACPSPAELSQRNSADASKITSRRRDLSDQIPDIPAVKSAPGAWGYSSSVIEVEELEIPRVMSETRSSRLRVLPDPPKLEMIHVPDILTSARKPRLVSPKEQSSPRRDGGRARVTPESPKIRIAETSSLSPARSSVLQDRLSAELRKENDNEQYKASSLQIDPEDFNSIVHRGSDIKMAGSVDKHLIQLVNSEEDGENQPSAIDEPIPKPYSRDLAISDDSESSTSNVESDDNVIVLGASNGNDQENKKKKTVEFSSLPVEIVGEGSRGHKEAGNESECENTSGEEYCKYSSDENGGQTSGNETDSKLSIINSESSESELGVDPELDPHVLYDSEAVRFVVQMLDRSCAWLEDDGCAACNYQASSASLSLLREIKKHSNDRKPRRDEMSQATTPKASNSRQSRVSGKATSLVRQAAKHSASSPLVQNLQQVKERRSQRAALRSMDTHDNVDATNQPISVFARPRRRQTTSPRRKLAQESESEEEPGPYRSPPRRRRSTSPRKRSTASSNGNEKDLSATGSATGSVTDRPVVPTMGEEDAAQESDTPISPFQKKLQERLASVRGHSDSSTSHVETPHPPSPTVSREDEQPRQQIPHHISVDTKGSDIRSSSSMRSNTTQPTSPVRATSSPIRTTSPRGLSPIRNTVPQSLSLRSSESRSLGSQRSSQRASSPESRQPSTLRGIAMDSSDARRTAKTHMSSPASGAPSRASALSADTARDSSRSRRDAPGSHENVSSPPVRRSPSSGLTTPQSLSPTSSTSKFTFEDSASFPIPVSPIRKESSRSASSSQKSREPLMRSDRVGTASSLGGSVQQSHASSNASHNQRATAARSSSSLRRAAGGPEQPQRLRKSSSGRSTSSVSSAASNSRSSYASRSRDYRLETIHELSTPMSSTASSPLGSRGGINPFTGLTEAERLAALELAEKLRRRASNLKRRRRAREKRLNDFLIHEDEESEGVGTATN